MQAYLDQLQYILDNGTVRGDRTGVGTTSVFGLNARYNMADGFPAVTTKKLAWKVMSSELLWFISGSTNINDLKAVYEHNRIWDANYEDYIKRPGLRKKGLEVSDGDMGRVYGSQWRAWRTTDGREIDQLQEAIELIKSNPESRRIIVNAWNPGEAAVDQVALPPCHSFFQFYVADNKLSLQMYQRSADMFLGVPFNIASYSLLLHMVARVTGTVAHEFIHTIGDAHIYLDAVDQVKEQISREPLPLPELHIEDRGQESIDDFVMDDFKLVNYQCHDAIKARMAV
ncbi:MAG: thymidylate synthase [Pseudomonadales bacterium]|nr:thymidylate synthase [Pseudomonadales bacterium]